MPLQFAHAIFAIFHCSRANIKFFSGQALRVALDPDNSTSQGPMAGLCVCARRRVSELSVMQGNPAPVVVNTCDSS